MSKSNSSSNSESNHDSEPEIQQNTSGEDDIIIAETEMNEEEKVENQKLIEKRRKKKAINKYGRLMINIQQCHYPVVKTVSKMFKIKTTQQEEDDWDLYWSDGAIQCDRLYRMKPY